jgi:Ras-related protein Rab-2A
VAAEKHMLFFETSAKKGENVDECFQRVTQDVYTQIEDGTIDPHDEQYGVVITSTRQHIPHPKNAEGGCSC